MVEARHSIARPRERHPRMEEVVDELIVVGRSDLEQSVMQHVAIPEINGTRYVSNDSVRMEVLQASRVLLHTKLGFT